MSNMREIVNIANRKFKFWFYQISHSEAIIRSPKIDLNKTYDTNIDIYLGDIYYIEMPCILQDLQIDYANEEDYFYLSRKLEKDISIEKIIVLVSGKKRYYIVASVIKFLENDLDYGVLPIHAFLANKEDRQK